MFKRKYDTFAAKHSDLKSDITKLTTDIDKLEKELKEKREERKLLFGKESYHETQMKYILYKKFIFKKEFESLGFCEDLFDIIFQYSLTIFIRFWQENYGYHDEYKLLEFYDVELITDSVYIKNYISDNFTDVVFGYRFGDVKQNEIMVRHSQYDTYKFITNGDYLEIFEHLDLIPKNKKLTTTYDNLTQLTMIQLNKIFENNFNPYDVTTFFKFDVNFSDEDYLPYLSINNVYTDPKYNVF